jgi:hypothetical protein
MILLSFHMVLYCTENARTLKLYHYIEGSLKMDFGRKLKKKNHGHC